MTYSPILAIDPGPTRSGWVTFGGPSLQHGIAANETLLDQLRWRPAFPVLLERIESFGMPVGAEVFDTVYWSGRFQEAAEANGLLVHYLTRRQVKLHLCGTARAKDPNVRQALLDRFGGTAAKGTKAAPGPLYGVAGDVWSALALAVTFAELEPAA